MTNVVFGNYSATKCISYIPKLLPQNDFNLSKNGLKLFKNSLITSYKDINQI